MSEILKLEAPPVRVETGPVQFGDDWPGVFIRGDHAMHYALALRDLLDDPNSAVSKAVVNGLISTLTMCDLSGVARPPRL